MLLNFTVPIPKLKGKISRQGTKSGTYIHYVLERSYDQKKKHTVPKRVLIGKRVGETETMVPNENFLVFFPDAVLPEVRENARRCSTLMAGSYIVIANIVQTYGLGKMLQKHFLDRAYLDYRCKNPMDAGCPSGSTSSRRFPGGLIFLEAR